MVLTSTSVQEETKKVNEEPKDSWDNNKNNQTFLQKTIIRSDLNGIQPRSTQVRNCDETGFYPNVSCNKVIYTYKLFQCEPMWKVHWRASNILVHITCLYPIQWAILHVTHHCAPSQGLLPISPLKHPTGLDSPSHTIYIYGYR